MMKDYQLYGSTLYLYPLSMEFCVFKRSLGKPSMLVRRHDDLPNVSGCVMPHLTCGPTGPHIEMMHDAHYYQPATFTQAIYAVLATSDN